MHCTEPAKRKGPARASTNSESRKRRLRPLSHRNHEFVHQRKAMVPSHVVPRGMMRAPRDKMVTAPQTSTTYQLTSEQRVGLMKGGIRKRNVVYVDPGTLLLEPDPRDQAPKLAMSVGLNLLGIHSNKQLLEGQTLEVRLIATVCDGKGSGGVRSCHLKLVASFSDTPEICLTEALKHSEMKALLPHGLSELWQCPLADESRSYREWLAISEECVAALSKRFYLLPQDAARQPYQPNGLGADEARVYQEAACPVTNHVLYFSRRLRCSATRVPLGPFQSGRIPVYFTASLGKDCCGLLFQATTGCLTTAIKGRWQLGVKASVLSMCYGAGAAYSRQRVDERCPNDFIQLLVEQGELQAFLRGITSNGFYLEEADPKVGQSHRLVLAGYEVDDG
ncbi:unnamed protein product [Chrysoparadoxa australica]